MALALVNNGDPGLTARTKINAGMTQQNNLGFINAKDLGAVGNGSSDDTAALQAAINAALAAQKSLYVPAGRYLISAGLTVAIAGNTSIGFQMYGDGDGIQDGSHGGTVFAYTGSGTIPAVLSILCWRTAYFHDFSVTSASTGIPTYGIVMPDNTWSGMRFSRVSCNFVGTAFGVLSPTGSNGELLHLHCCQARAVNGFWYSEAGQAYVHTFIDCTCVLNDGGTYFKFNLPSAGGGINVWNFSATGDHSSLSAGQTTNTTLVSVLNGGMSSCLNFIGGRVEWLTQLLFNVSSSQSLDLTPMFYGMQFTVDNITNGTNTTNKFIDSQNHADIIVMRHCKFEGLTTGAKLDTIGGYSPQPYVLWENCVFEQITDPTASPVTNEKFTGCVYRTGSTNTLKDGIGTWT